MNNIPEYSAIVIIVSFLIKEMFTYLKSKKGCQNGNLSKEIKTIGENHLEHMYGEMQKQTSQHERMIEILVEINTRLKK